MKRCPACDKTFADGMKFCQTDGTLLVEDAPPADPYKTVVGNQSDIASAIPPLDPFKTMVASPPKPGEDDLLQLPDEPDLLKTKMIPRDELRAESKSGEAEDMLSLDSPPNVASAPLIEPKPAGQSDFSAPAPPKSGEPSLNPPTFGNLPSPEPGLPKPSETGASDATAIFDIDSPPKDAPSPFDSKPFPNDFSTTQSPYGNQENKPIPSPFQDPLPSGYQPPSASPFDAPKPPPFKEAEPMFGGGQESSSQSPFQPPSPFGNAEPFNPPLQQTEWTPPPAPVSEWQNQDLGANTPFQPPVAATGQNQTLPIVSLVLGILSICCYISPLTGIAALITGYLGMKNADSDPTQYGGKTMAIIGMILGGLFLLIGLAYYIFVLILGISGFIPN